MENQDKKEDWREAVAEIWAMFKETDQKFKETEQQMKETAQQMKETAQQMKETDKKIKELSRMIGDLSNQWGRFIENTLAPNLSQELAKYQVYVRQIAQRTKARQNGKTMEVDLLAIGDKVVVSIEVKSVLKVADINHHLEKLEQFKEFFPQYKDYKVLGGVAGMEIVEGADTYAMGQGLFVIGQKGELAKVLNPIDFQPKVW